MHKIIETFDNEVYTTQDVEKPQERAYGQKWNEKKNNYRSCPYPDTNILMLNSLSSDYIREIHTTLPQSAVPNHKCNRHKSVL